MRGQWIGVDNMWMTWEEWFNVHEIEHVGWENVGMFPGVPGHWGTGHRGHIPQRPGISRNTIPKFDYFIKIIKVTENHKNGKIITVVKKSEQMETLIKITETQKFLLKVPKIPEN